MKLKDLFDKVNELNKIYSEIGYERQYGIKLLAMKVYYDFQIFHYVYTDIDELEKAIREETYMTNIGEEEITLTETSDGSIEDVVWELKISMPDAMGKVETARYLCVIYEIEED